jgi:hypothetical protein
MRKTTLTALFVVLSHHAAAQAAPEKLVLSPPPGFKVVHEDRLPDIVVVQMVPASQSRDVWTEKLIVTTTQDRGRGTLSQVRSDLERQLRDVGCKEVKSTQVSQSTERGFESAVWYQSCSANPPRGMPELLLFKAIRGAEAMHVIAFTFNRAPTPEQLASRVKALRDAHL